MSDFYVVYRKEDTYAEREPYGGVKSFRGEAAAKGALTRLIKKGKADREGWAVAERGDFYENIEKKFLKKNLMSGTEYWEGRNVPNFLSPSSETYWSM